MLTEHLSTCCSLELPERVVSDPVFSERSVSRMTMRQVLLTGLEEVVRFDHVFDHYEVRGAGNCGSGPGGMLLFPYSPHRKGFGCGGVLDKHFIGHCHPHNSILLVCSPFGGQWALVLSCAAALTEAESRPFWQGRVHCC